MNLKIYLDKNVKIVDRDGDVFTGKVCEYVFPEDNENGKESIIVEISNAVIEFNEVDIKSIIVT